MKQLFSTSLRLSLIATILTALWLEMFSAGYFAWGAFLYFTIQSNILVLITLIVQLRSSNKVSMFKTVLTGITLLSITVTGIVYNFALYNVLRDWGSPAYALSRTLTHVIVPLGFILVWLLLEKHGLFRWRQITLWIMYPLVYGGIFLYISLTRGMFLYSFMDSTGGFYSMIGPLTMAVSIILMVAFVFVGLDKLLGRAAKNNLAGKGIQDI